MCAMAPPRSRTLILGLGNTLMCDDGVGPLAARAIHRALPEGTADLLDGPLVGLDLAVLMEGYERVVLIDALAEPGAPVGEVQRLSIPDPGSDPGPAPAPLSSHGMGLAPALELLRRLGADLPARIEVYGIVARHTDRLHEGLSEDLQERLPGAVEAILTRAFPASDGPAAGAGAT